MTPCIEHFLRYFSVEQLYFPFTLLLSKEDKKLVIGISKFRKSFLVKQWKLFETKKEDSLPQLEKLQVKNIESLLKDERIVIPDYQLLDFKEIRHRKEIQEATGYFAKIQENQYYRDIDNFLYPDIQKVYRMNWVWAEFCRIHEMHEFGANINLFNLKLKYLEKEIWGKWLLWKKHLLQAKNIAPELLFYKAYKMHLYSKKENSPRLSKPNWTQLTFHNVLNVPTGSTGNVTYTITYG